MVDNKLLFEADSSPAVRALAELREAANGVNQAFKALSESSPRKFQAEMAKAATSMSDLTRSIVANLQVAVSYTHLTLPTNREV